MIALCPACHARIHRTLAVAGVMPSLLLTLWREQHPRAHEQIQLNFFPALPPAQPVPLFPIPTS